MTGLDSYDCLPCPGSDAPGRQRRFWPSLTARGRVLRPKPMS